MTISKSSLLLALLLPGLFLSDIVYGVLLLKEIETSLTPGVVMRGGLFLTAVVLSFVFSRDINLKLLFIIIILCK